MQNSITREQIVSEARRWIGTPYQHQASLIHVGCDCLGLVRGVWRACVGPEPQIVAPYSPDWAEASREERLAGAGFKYFTPVDVTQFEAGDVLLFRWRPDLPAKHAAIATSSSSMVHAHDGASVVEVPLIDWWRRRLSHAFAFPLGPGR